MTTEKFIDNLVRPLLGDGIKSDLPEGSTQSFKYDTDFLLDMLNETIYDIAKKTDFFRKKGVGLAQVDSTEMRVPQDFFGLISSDNTSTGNSYDTDANLSELSLSPTPTGIEILPKPDRATLERLGTKVQGVVLHDTILDGLVESGYIDPSARVIRDIDIGSVFIEYTYKYLPQELHKSTEISALGHRGLLYTLRWGVAYKALWGNLHNEAFNVAKVYYDKYTRMRDDLGHAHHNWNSIAL